MFIIYFEQVVKPLNYVIIFQMKCNENKPMTSEVYNDSALC